MSKQYVIEGSTELRGEIPIWGAKNAISKQLIASLLTKDACVFHNVPRISEIETVLKMLHELGSNYEWISENSLRIQTESIAESRISTRYSGLNRLTILFVGVLVARTGTATVPIVGGCNIGPRPIDYHLDGLRKMGVNFEESSDGSLATCTRLNGCSYELPFVSIGATENLLLAAVLAEGKTVISNAAMEPEIIDTILVLQKMGAEIFVDAGRRIIISGVKELRGVEHSVIPDRMEVASLAIATIATNGMVKVINAKQEHVITLLNSLRRMGADFLVENDGITFFRKERQLRPIHIETDVHPSFMTDWQQPFVVGLTQAVGVSIIHETIYENRFGFTRTLNEMGAVISVTSHCLGSKQCRFSDKNYLHSAVVSGPTKLKALRMDIPDLRAGFAYVVAALIAEGTTTLTGLGHLDRGHPELPRRLRALGAKIDVQEVMEAVDARSGVDNEPTKLALQS